MKNMAQIRNRKVSADKVRWARINESVSTHSPLYASEFIKLLIAGAAQGAQMLRIERYWQPHVSTAYTT